MFGGFGSTATLGCVGFAIVNKSWLCEIVEYHTAKSGCATYAMPRQRSTALPIACAMISCRLGRRAEFYFVFREAGRSTPMMAADRSSLSFRAILFLVVSLGLPGLAHPATLEDSAKELAQKIAAALPAKENVSCEIRNLSSLQPGEVVRIEQSLKAELQERGVRLTDSGAEIIVVVTLSENYKSLVWTGEIHKGDASQVVLIAVERSSENRAFSKAMPVTIRREKFWEGPERILDAGEVSNGAGKSWLVLLLPEGLRIQDQQTGSASTLEIKSMQSASRDPWGNLNFDPVGNTIAFFLAPRVCTVNLETPDLNACPPADGSPGGPLHWPFTGDVRSLATGSTAAGQRHPDRNEACLRRREPVSGDRRARLYANGFGASVPDGVERRRRGQRRTGFPGADHGIARDI